jgi:hypothetical protein
MMKRILPLIYGLAQAALAAQPGELLESIRPPLHAPANITDACLDAEGNIYLWGGFSSVDGVDSGGIARLGADGGVDRILAGNLVPPNEQMFFWFVDPIPWQSPRRIIALADGRLMVSQPGEGGALIDSEGNIDRGFFTGMPVETRAYPQFEREGNYYFVIAGNGARRLVRQSVTTTSWQPETIPSETWPWEPAMAIAGPNDTIRVLASRVDPYAFTLLPTSVQQSVFLANPDGMIVEGSQLSLDAGRRASIVEDRDGGYLLHYGSPLFWAHYWPSPDVQANRLEWRDEANSPVRTIDLTSPLYHPFVFAGEADGSFVATGRDGLLTRYLPDSEPDPAFNKHAGVRSLIKLPDGKYLLNATRRILANGEPDPDWHAPRLEVPASVSRLLRLKSGRVLMAGNFHRSGERPLHRLQVFTSSGELWDGWKSDPRVREARDLAETPDGKIVVITSEPVVLPNGATTDLIRLLPNGEFDESFFPDPPLQKPFVNLTSVSTISATPQSDGTILVATSNGGRGGNVLSWTLGRILQDRTTDPGFATRTGFGTIPPKPLVLPDNTFFFGANLYSADGALMRSAEPDAPQFSHIPLCLMPDGAVMFSVWNGTAHVLRRWKNGAWDRDFVGELPDIQGAAPGAAGKLYVWGAGDAPIARLHRNGRVDVTFRAPAFSARTHRHIGGLITHSTTGFVSARGSSISGHGIVADLFHDPVSENLWIGGSFNLVDAIPRDGLAVLDGSNVAGFSAWAAAALRGGSTDLTPDADPDSDGVPNWLEYATGADPARADAPRSSLQPTGAHGFAIPRNPEAPEILASIEVSEDLETWRDALASEVVIDSAGSRLEFALLPNASARFARVRFQLGTR